MNKEKRGISKGAFWGLMLGLGIAGQLCWNIENQWFNTFIYAKIAKKNGHGENLNDPAHSVKPAIREVISRSGTAKNISQYLWAAVGVGVAMQKPWDTFFMDATFKFWKGKNFINTIKAFPKTLAQSSAEFFKGAKTGNVMQRHAGKMLLGVAALSSVLGIINSVVGARTKKCHSHIIKQDERCVVS